MNNVIILNFVNENLIKLGNKQIQIKTKEKKAEETKKRQAGETEVFCSSTSSFVSNANFPSSFHCNQLNTTCPFSTSSQLLVSLNNNNNNNKIKTITL